MTIPGILVLGTPEVKKWPIASEILQDQQQNQTHHPPADVHQWHINTKYYTATIQIEIHHLKNNNSVFTIDDHIQAVVMVFNPTSPSSFTHLKSWWHSLLKQNPNLDIPIKLIIPSPPISELQQWHIDDVLHWSASQMIEYIDHGIPLLSTTEEEDIGDIGGRAELRGIDRLIEALHSHMWPELERKNVSIKSSETTKDSGGDGGEDVVSMLADDNIDPLLLYGDEEDDDSGDNINKMFAEMYTLRDMVGTSSYEERRDMVGSIGARLMAAIGLNLGDVLVGGSDDDDSEEEDEEEEEEEGEGKINSSENVL